MGSRRVGSSMSNTSYDFNEYEDNTPLVPIEPYLPRSELEHTVQWSSENQDNTNLNGSANPEATSHPDGTAKPDDTTNPDGILAKNLKSSLPDLDGLCYMDYR